MNAGTGAPRLPWGTPTGILRAMAYALEVYAGDQPVFRCDGKWLFPLFEFENFMNNHGLAPAELTVHDKIVGKAAALLLVRLKVARVVAAVLSRPAQAALEHFCVPYRYTTLVERITCETEQLLLNEWDPETAYDLVKNRIQAC